MPIPKEQEPKYTTNSQGVLCTRLSNTPIPPDEPIMIFRAKDKNALLAIAYYQRLCKVESHKLAVTARMEQFMDFSHNNPEKMKEPDTRS